MKRAIALMVQDLKEGRHIENYVLILTAMVVAALSLFGGIKQEIIDSLILAVLSLLIYREIENARSLRSLRKTHLRGIRDFYIDRSELPSFEDWLRSCKEEIAIMGVQLGGIAHSYLPRIEQRARAGCRVRLLMMSPVVGNSERLPWVDQIGQVHTFVGLQGILLANLSHIKYWLDQIGDRETRSRIEVRLYTTIPTVSMILFDKDANGFIKVEPLIHKVAPQDRPSFLLERADSPKLYDQLVGSFNKMWEEAIDINETVP